MKIEGLPEYISKNDLDCNDGCGRYKINADLVEMIVKLTNYIRLNYCREAYPIFHSMTRCLKYNRSIGSKDTSTHVKSTAADLHYANFAIYKLHEIASSVHYNKNILSGGLGYYDWGIHIDVDKFRVWGSRLPFEKPKPVRGFFTGLLNLFQWRPA